MKVINVVGARPNFMKIAPIMREMQRREHFHPILLHTGQHYDDAMSRVFFDDLNIPRPDIYLGVGSGSHAEQTARIMVEFERIVAEQRPDLVLVVGDVNSTLACSVVAAKMQVPVAHVEAGLRSFDRTMPEEINRLVTDALSSLLFTTERSANENLLREGHSADRIHFVGNVMIDTLLASAERAEQSNILERLSIEDKGYAVLTLHRPGNVDDPAVLSRILDGLEQVQKRVQVVFPAHPRTSARFEAFGLSERVQAMDGLRVIEPLGYLDFLKLMAHAKLVLTDSGGLQEETTVLGVPCLTLRENTERPVTITEGTNVLVGTSPEAIVRETLKVLEEGGNQAPRVVRRPELWDGHAAERITAVLEAWDAEGRKVVVGSVLARAE
ncbi:MAG: non-hydrolyzing UDP-N-acetylglucosamine 2-epimerase [Armatimonadota bacterium]